MRVTTAAILSFLALSGAAAVPLSTEDIFRHADFVADVRVESIHEMRLLEEGGSLWRARVVSLYLIKGFPPEGEDFLLYYEAPAVRFAAKNSVPGTAFSCPPYVKLAVHEEVTIAASYRDFAGLRHIPVVSHDGSIIHHANQ
jgi:hypothetical protein